MEYRAHRDHEGDMYVIVWLFSDRGGHFVYLVLVFLTIILGVCVCPEIALQLLRECRHESDNLGATRWSRYCHSKLIVDVIDRSV